MKLVFATNNQHKLEELQNMLSDDIQLLSLKDVEVTEEIPETQETLEGNASQKAHYIYDRLGLNCFADDTGLEIEALNGAPGVYSARFAGPQRLANDNMKKVLSQLNEINDRSARFRTVISLIIDGKEVQFEGIVDGEITVERSGADGFGYDPIFKPLGYQQTFAEMNMNEKNKISHRAHAVQKLVEYLNKLS